MKERWKITGRPKERTSIESRQQMFLMKLGERVGV